ncbi:MAG: polyketide cyclase [Archangium gephyra]|uniref:Polyketide cyclase n=1 Tax=Archangium gephyra TaxID=48 RepID=A0A2W5TQ57_9BACT|nr:MAG: polyketide cyclase [Archangium gephyra]
MKPLIMERIFKAPRELVWRALSDPAEALQWLGPREFPAVKFETEGRVGGTWRACLKGPGGEKELWQGGVIRELVPNEKLSFTFKWDEPDAIETVVTYTLSDAPGGTRMVFQQEPFSSEASRESHRGGWDSTFDRLAEWVQR